MKQAERWVALSSRSAAVVCMVLMSACRLAAGAGSAGADHEAAQLPEVLVRADLQALVEAGLDRRSGPLIEALTTPDASLRATAAHVLASVQDQAARPALTALLGDPAARVRREAAFALGQLGDLPDGPPLVDALRTELTPAVRLVLMEAAGKGGDVAALRAILNAARPGISPEEDLGLALALYHFGRRGVTDRRGGLLLSHLLAEETNAQVAVTAALALAAPRNVAEWGIGTADVRRALETMPYDRPAAGPLLGIIARDNETTDAPLLRGWLEQGRHWRIRVAAARALGDHRAGGSSAARGALAAALDDRSPHVAATAARALVGLPRPDRADAAEADGRMDPDLLVEWIRAHPERPAVAAALLPGLVDTSQEGVVLEWARGDLGPGARPALAWPALALIGSPEADLLLTAGLRGDRRVTYTAAAAMADRLAGLHVEAPLRDTLIPLVTRRLDLWGPHAPMSDVRGLLRLVRDLVENRPGQSEKLLAAAAHHPHTALRDLAEQLGGAENSAPTPSRRTVDWRLLAMGGARPQLEFTTEGGSFLVELHPEIAPLAVSSLMSWAASGMFDDLTFHRVEPDFILQSGDLRNPRGHGGPTLGLRSEFTRLRYAPGVLGMASAGKDTEGSQYFITHGFSPSLDGRYGAVGRIVSGLEVADGVALGDPIISVLPVGWNGRSAPERR